MAISKLNPVSTASAPFAGAGSVVASAFSSKGWYSTSLAAGKYIVNVNTANGGGPHAQALSTPGFGVPYGYSSYENSIFGENIQANTPTVINMTTAGTLYLCVGPSLDTTNSNSYREGSYSPGDADGGPGDYYTGGQSRFYLNSANADYKDGIPVVFQSNNTNRVYQGYHHHIKNGAPNVNSLVYAKTYQGYTGYTMTEDTSYPTIGFKPIGSTRWYNASLANSSTLRSSTDCVTWTNVTSAGSTGSYRDVCKFSGTNHVAVTDSTTAATNISYSTDGLTWSTTNSGVSAALYCVTYGNGLYVAAGNSVITTSTDGVTWTSRTNPTTMEWHIAMYSNGVYLLVGKAINASGVLLARSTNGTTWTTVAPATSALTAGLTSDTILRQYTFSGAINPQNNGYQRYRFVATSDGFYAKNNSVLNYSSDGINWVALPMGMTMQQSEIIGWDSTASELKTIGFSSLTGGGGRASAVYYQTPANYTIYQSTIS